MAQLNKQLAGIRALERQRQCSGATMGGFFNPCRDLANRRARVERQIAQASASAGGAVASLRARYRSLGCEGNRRERERVIKARAEPRRDLVRPRRDEREVARTNSGTRKAYVRDPAFTGRTMLFCVRLSDGYFFPAPNSQFVNASYASNSLDRCRYICDTQDIEVFRLDDLNNESEDMVSVETGRKYGDLPRAFAYRDDPKFKRCDFDRYIQRVSEYRARSVTPSNMSAAIIPLPTTRPEIQATPMKAASVPAEPVAIDPDREVRVVLPGYLSHDG